MRPLDVACPTCGAREYHDCRAYGKRTRYHTERVRAAEEQERERVLDEVFAGREAEAEEAVREPEAEGP